MKDTPPRRILAVGVGDRFGSFAQAIATAHRNDAQLVALCDTSRVRLENRRQRLVEKHGYPVLPIGGAEDFERLIRENKADTVLVTSKDSTHHEYIVRALHAGCDAVTEKPMTTDAEKCRAIMDAVKATGRRVRVCFNYRWAPGATKVREVVASGAIGRVHSVNLDYLLNTRHGGDYFRRWHSEKESSGGLLVHKATHHFDLVNWWIDAVPARVFAFGNLAYYGKANAIARGEEQFTRYPRYTGHETGKDPFALDLREHPGLKALYMDAERETGYLRDRNVFRDGINIEDTMALSVRYRNGVLFNYSLNAFGPYEGYRVAINGDKGRLEYFTRGPSWMMLGQSTDEQAKANPDDASTKSLRVLPLFEPSYEVAIPKAEGGHGGADPLLMAQIFSANPPAETWGRNAGHEQGAASILVGIAANESMARGAAVDIDSLVPLRPAAKRLTELI